MSEPVRDILVAGGGLAGWYCAARLSQALAGRAMRVRVLHAAAPGADPDPLDPVCASTLPSQVLAHEALGIDERAFMRECRATFKVATLFAGFSAGKPSYLWPFGEIGARLESVGFHHFLGRLLAAGHELDIDAFSVPAIAARLGRFAHPANDPRSVLSTYEYAYHLDTAAYTGLLRQFAERRGVQAIDADLGAVERDAGGHITALRAADGTRLEADLFIDCTGTRAALLGESLGVAFESWAQWLPNDGAVVAAANGNAAAAPCTRIAAQPEGWISEVPLRGASQYSLLFDSASLSAAAARAKLLAGVRADSAKTLRFANGRRREPWSGNCIAVGTAAGFLEPLVATGLRLVDESVTRLVALFPDRGHSRILAAEYNRLVGAAYESARDFTLLHHVVGGRSPPAAPLPAALAEKLELFRYRGRVLRNDDELFEEADWACTLIGQGECPARHALLATLTPEPELLEQIAKIARLMHTAVLKLPTHTAYLDRYLA
jgi:tryptophan halogenase